MIDVARTGTPASVACLRQDAAHLGFADHVFHGAIICLALHEKPEGTRQAIVREAVRVLVPGGLLFLIDFAPPRGAVGWSFRLGLTAVERLVGRDHYANFRSYTAQGGLAGITTGLPLSHTGGGSRFFAGNIVFMALSSSL
jgi:ubiquinone/menaquinone biosynthesis C-methylase UbiE